MKARLSHKRGFTASYSSGQVTRTVARDLVDAYYLARHAARERTEQRAAKRAAKRAAAVTLPTLKFMR